MNKVDRARLFKNVDRFTSWKRIIKKSGKEFKEYRSMSFCMWVQFEEKVFLGTLALRSSTHLLLTHHLDRL